MKSLIAILLTVLIFLNLFGFYTLFLFQRADLRKEMAERISQRPATEPLGCFTFEKQEFEKLPFGNNGKEIQINGSLYDVVKIASSGNTVKVFVEADTGETDLVETFGSVFSQQQEKGATSSPVKIIISHFQQDYVLNNQDALMSDSNAVISYLFLNKFFLPQSFVADKFVPPPQVFFA